MHPVDIESTLATFSIMVDSREQKWAHIEKSLNDSHTPYNVKKLNYGDYTCTAMKPNGEMVSLADKYVIERKRSLDELCGNFTKGRERFEREFKRSQEDKAKVFLMIEDSQMWVHIRNHAYRSKLPPKSLLATLCSWQARYNITILTCDQCDSGTLVKGILWYALRDYLQKGVD